MGKFSIFVLFAGLFFISACYGPGYQNEKVTQRGSGYSVALEESSLNEYIIALEPSATVESALISLQEYEPEIIKDLKRGRYLIGLKLDPGLDRLKMDVKGSNQIKYIQPNFSYTIQ